ncbi:CAP domain-containing protein [Streptomyces flavofungini]|uniref:CAP domain-containing protein n=1 Tax=Streptomyces flavofungini TaxID=68200 RepID=UPI0025AF5252|nr:CAP domain-containing protein [Streptomyces flavofungini]WJV44294.1 CAP domain-containing protein [Streptomyces flavofungini]
MNPQDPADPLSRRRPADSTTPGGPYPHHPDPYAHAPGTGPGRAYPPPHGTDAHFTDDVTAISPAASGAPGPRAELRQRRTTRRRRQAIAAGAGIAAIATLTAVMQWGSDGSDTPEQTAAAAAMDTGTDSDTDSDTDEPTSSSEAPSATPKAKKPESASPSKPAEPKKSESAKPSKKPERAPAGKPEVTKPSAPPRTSRPAPTPTPKAPSAAASGSTAQQVLGLVNAERQKAGCRPLTNNSKLATAAQRHSADMKARNYFSHTSPDGTDPGKRITAAGYRWSTYGENIARGQQTAKSVMSSWMNSEGHRANILNCSFKELGVGIVKGSGGPWWTQNFGAR